MLFFKYSQGCTLLVLQSLVSGKHCGGGGGGGGPRMRGASTLTLDTTVLHYYTIPFDHLSPLLCPSHSLVPINRPSSHLCLCQSVNNRISCRGYRFLAPTDADDIRLLCFTPLSLWVLVTILILVQKKKNVS